MPEPKLQTRQNVALGKPARQSSLSSFSNVFGNDAEGAVNGIKTGRFGFHTSSEASPWWQVDLEGLYEIEEIVVYNRVDGGGERADTMRVLVSEDEQRWRQLPEWNGGRFGGVDGNPARIRPRTTVARYVRLQLAATNYLHLDEVEVYGRLVAPVDVSERLDPDASFSFDGLGS